MSNYPFALALVSAALLALVVDRWERWRLARPGRYAAADFSGVILLAALAAALWGSLTPTLLAILLGSVAVFLISALTDQWRPTRGLRFAAALLAALWLSSQGVGVQTVKVPFSDGFVALGWLGPVVSALWLALSGSLFARAATIPRVALGVGAMAAGTLYLVHRMQPEITDPASAPLNLALCGACLGMYLLPGRLSHGGATAGGYALGFLVGAAAVLGALKHTAFLVALLPLMVIGVPVFATGFAWVAEAVKGRRRPLGASRHPHLHEILLRQGYSPGQVTLILLLGTALLCGLGLVLVALIEVTFALKALLLLLALAAGLIFLFVFLRLMKPARLPAVLPAEVEVLGVRVHRVTMAEAMARVAEFIREDRPHLIVTSDATGVMKCQDDEEFRRIVNGADLVTADGAGVILAARLLGLPMNARVSGCDMVVEISRVAAGLGRAVFLLGAAPGVADKAAEKLQEQIPGLQVAGCQDGYFKPEDETALINRIAEARPAALFVALGIPRQEKWLQAHLEELNVPVCIGIGGSFDVISGLKKRAPRWMQRTGLEWLWRAAKEPSRLPRLIALPRIVIMTFGTLLRAPEAEEENHE
jgi:N-acetylglucosaminyldiphosphoundecaprenol N-acetyl-beta-D-mannosaminyltransferase